MRLGEGGAVRLTRWSDGPPPVGVTVAVWFWSEVRRARWDGAHWRDTETGEILDGVTHWQAIA